jgi:hypothetical protein
LKTKVIIILFFTFLTFIFPHGLILKVEKASPFITVNSSYPGATVLSDCLVRIKLKDPDVAFQVGHTDKNGNFSFKPDVEGTYIFTIDDEMGHKKSINILIGSDFLKISPTETDKISEKKPAVQDQTIDNKKKNDVSKVEHTEKHLEIFRILFGVTLILFITLLFYTLKKNR